MQEQSGHSPGGAPATALTECQREIAILVAEGATNRMIADRLGLEAGAVSAHVARLLWTLGLTRRAQVAIWAARQGLYPPHSPSRRTDADRGSSAGLNGSRGV